MAKDLTIDALKGLAILGVVIIHSTFYENQFFPNSFLDIFSKFCVPMFIFISGYFVFKQKDFIFSDFKKYLARRFNKIGLPYLLMTLIITVSVAVYNQFPLIIFIKKLLINTFLGLASVPYYFVIIIFQLYLLSKVILYLYSNYYRILWVLAIGLILGYSVMFYTSISLPYFMWQFPNYLLWFVLGIEYSANGPIYRFIDNIKLPVYLISFILLLSLCVLEINHYYVMKVNDGGYIALSSILWEFIAIITFWKYKNILSNKLLIKLGEYSFGIFLLHKPILDVAFNVFNIPKLPELSLIYTFCAILISIFFIKIIGNVTNILRSRIKTANLVK